MSTYCVTFRIADRPVGGASYAERRQRLIDNIHREGMGFWDATTSFFLVEANESTREFAARACNGLSEKFDIVVVFDPDDMSMVHFGAVPNPEILDSFFRFTSKLT